MNVERRERVIALNDELRRTHSGGHVLVSQSLAALGATELGAIVDAVRRTVDFERQDDRDVHDFGWVTVGAVHAAWKIDCYNQSFQETLDVLDPSTIRVLSIMKFSEYWVDRGHVARHIVQWLQSQRT